MSAPDPALLSVEPAAAEASTSELVMSGGHAAHGDDVRVLSASQARAIADTAPEYVSVGTVAAHQLTEAVVWSTPAGDKMRGAAGDWAVSDGVNVWTVQADVFAGSYRPAPEAGEGRYRKTAVAKLVRIDRKFVVETLDGWATGMPGDYLAVGPAGDAWVVPAERRAVRYRPARAEIEDAVLGSAAPDGTSA